MKKKRVTVLISDNHRELPMINENIDGVTSGSTLTVESATVYWDYNNVIRGVNDTFTHNGNIIRLPEGYWTLDMISNIRDTYIVYNETGSHYATVPGLYIAKSATGGCSVFSNHINYTINLGKFGPLIGFDENTVISPKVQSLSQNRADINRGLKYITVSCDIVDDAKNIDTDGRRSNVIATIPVPLGADLKNSITQHYIDPESSGGTLLQNGCYNKLVFDVNTNIGQVPIGSVLLELCINYR